MQVIVSDVGTAIHATIEGGRVTVTRSGGCGPDCLGKTVPAGASAARIEEILTARFVRLASRNMGERYDAKANELTVCVIE